MTQPTFSSVKSPATGRAALGRSPVLIAREHERRSLIAAIQRTPSLVRVHGEAGVGKTRLLAEALAEPELGEYWVGTGHCQPLREPFPFGAVLDGLRCCQQRLLERKASDQLNPVTGALRFYLPELSEVLPPAPQAPPEATARRHQLFRGVLGLLEALGPSLMVVEDLHWADHGSIELLRFLLSQPPAQLGVVLTSRGDSDSGGGVGSSALSDSLNHLTLRLDALNEAGTGELACSLLGGPPCNEIPDSMARVLHEATAGIPFVVEEAVRAFAESLPAEPGADGVERLAAALRGGPHGPGEDGVAVPLLLRSTMLERLSGLTHSARLITEAAAVLGRPAELRLLCELASLDAEEGRTALIEALANETLTQARTCLYGFRHALAQRAVYQTLSGPEREKLHHRAITVLAVAEPQPLVQLAEHSMRSGSHEEWLRYGEQASDAAAAAGDIGTATNLLMQLLDHAPLTEHDVQRLASKLGPMSNVGIEQRTVIDALRRLMGDNRLSDALRGELRLWLGLMQMRQYGAIPEARQNFELAIPELRAQPALAARCMAVLGLPFAGTDPISVHRSWRAKAEAELAGIDDPLTRLTLQANTLGARLHVGDTSVWQVIDQLPVSSADAEEQRMLAKTWNNISDAASWVGYLQSAQEFSERALALVSSVGAPYTRTVTTSGYARLDWLAGRWEGLAARAESALRATPELNSVTAESALVLGNLAMVAGDSSAAEYHFSRTGIARADGTIFPVVAGAHGGLMRIRMAREDFDGALASADNAMTLLRHKEGWCWAGEVAVPAVMTYRHTGHEQRALGVAEDLAAGLDGLSAPLAEAALSFCRGLLADVDGAGTKAVGYFAHAESAYREIGAVYYAELAREKRLHRMLATQQDDPGVLSESPDGPASPAAMSELAERLADMGATVDAARCRHWARHFGAPQHSRRGRRGYGTELSPRELDVARMISAGSTNREIAEALFLSRRTVEQHVANVLRKLGARSRRELEGSTV